MKRKLEVAGTVVFIVAMIVFYGAKYLGYIDNEAATKSTSRQVQAEMQPSPMSFMICKYPGSAQKRFNNEINLKITNGEYRSLADISNTCEQVTVMSSDISFVIDFNGMGDRQFNREYPVAFEVQIVDANCERQCPSKASGWVSSYELPLELWPTGEEWINARFNRLTMDAQVDGMAGADRFFKSATRYEPEWYNRARDARNKGIEFLRNYGL